MKKILFVAQNLQIGGVQRALVNLLDTISSEDDVCLFLFGDGPLKSELPQHIKIIHGKYLLRLAATPFQEILRTRKPFDILLRCMLMILVRLIGSEKLYALLFKSYLQDVEFDIAVSYFTDVPNNYFNQGTTQYVSDCVRAKEKIAWIHTDPILSNFDRDTCLFRFRDMDRLVCVSEAIRKKTELLLPEYASKMVVFHNCFNPARICELAKAYTTPYSDDVFNIVTVGRIDDCSKRINEILQLCARLKTEQIGGFHWYIVGEGPDLSKNRELANTLSLTDVLTFCGAENNPYPYIQNADLFALYSAYEGFPMVVGEAQALGTYILTTNYASAKEQISHGQGYIAENDEDFYQELKRLIQCRN